MRFKISVSLTIYVNMIKANNLSKNRRKHPENLLARAIRSKQFEPKRRPHPQEKL